ncbi:unnamed protein product (macronuclear) [Paramecium tetraurelia]|uniref:Uncharacterized protein n=1 Tax=Paramecium tetraurelia TaxID=5888 RepID=A0BX87_PARTE|nr:uncharacterized protein GSPATT00033007001 [Paramecium tetraurelia]CAK63154.1 unnamed protein product [Paramecium tetraurelia]|eukprot:XP_001430552.1 hypothetical protein (macronuclear) [Paramecium tetraurelia strain d4-2]
MSNNFLSKIDLQQSLAYKYSQQDTYYYTKSLNEYIDNARLAHVINFHYETNFNEESEQLRRTYNIRIQFCIILDEIATKLPLLTEYYKYHNEIPRCFLHKLADIMSRQTQELNYCSYHDKKRRIEYFRIKRMIEKDNKSNPNQPKKKIVGEEPDDTTTQKSGRQYSNVLNDITEVSKTIDKIQTKLNSIKLNVGDLLLMPSNREQDQLDKFLKYLTEKKYKKQMHITQTPNSVSLKLPIGLSQKTIKQVLSRKMINQQSTQITQQTISSNKSTKQQSLYQQPFQIQSSPRINIKQLPKQIGSFTQRAVKENALSKLLSPLQVQIFNTNSQHSNKCKTSISISKQFKITDSVKSSIRLHQHTKSDFKFFKKL